MENYYEVLNCESNASYEELKRAYQKLALKYHPDKVGHEHQNACNRFILINKAWNILSDPELRRRFDERWVERCLAQDWPVQEEVDIQDFEQSETGSGSEKPFFFRYPCRCGGFYELTESDIELKFDMVCCNTCSLCVKLKKAMESVVIRTNIVCRRTNLVWSHLSELYIGMKLPPLNWYRQFLSSGIFGYCSDLKRTSSLQYLSSTVATRTTEGFHFFGVKSVLSRAKIKWLWTRNVHVTVPFQYFKPRIKKHEDDEIRELLVKYAVKFEAIAEILGGDKDLAYRLVISDTRFLQCYLKETLREKIELLQHYGFSFREIVNSHHALLLSKNTLEERLKRMQSHKIYSYSLGHLIRGKATFEKMAAVFDQEAKLMEGFTTKEGFLASVLKCTEDDVIKMAQDGHLYLQDHLLTSIVDLVSLYQQYGITLEDIQNDPGFLSIKYVNALRRTKILKDYNVTDKKVIRFVMSHTVTMDEAAERHAKIWRQDADALGEAKSLEELLCRDLQCTPADFERMCATYENIRFCSPHKCKKTINLLVGEYGMPKEWLVHHPVIFYYSTDRLKYRYEFLTEIGVDNLDSIFKSMCLTKRAFLRRYKDFAENYTHKS